MTKQEGKGGETYCQKNADCVLWGKMECPFRHTGKAYSECTAFSIVSPTKKEEIYWYITTLLVPVAQGTVSGFAATTQILEYLHSQGVVLKVERVLPHLTRGVGPALYTFQEGIDCMLKAGYVAVEPLIEEEHELMEADATD